jgi:flavin-dependent dehydrogenase
VVVGAGPSGLATAIGLCSHGLSVQLVEAARRRQARIGETVPADIRTSLEELGTWTSFSNEGHLASKGNISAWGGPDLARQDSFLWPAGHGWHLDRLRFEQMLESRARDVGVPLSFGHRLAGLVPRQQGGFVVHTTGHAGPSAISTRTVVDATGRGAFVARRLGSKRLVHDRMACRYAFFAGTGRAGENATTLIEPMTLIESVEDGWWYATHVPGGGSLAAFFTSAHGFRLAGYADAAVWAGALRKTGHIAGVVGHATTSTTTGGVVVLTLHCLDRPAGLDWVAVGDAASSLDPLASAGIALALRDGLRTAAAIAAYLNGDGQALARQAAAVQRRFSRYLFERRAYYRLERRWRRSPFWRERSGLTTPPA